MYATNGMNEPNVQGFCWIWSIILHLIINAANFILSIDEAGKKGEGTREIWKACYGGMINCFKREENSLSVGSIAYHSCVGGQTADRFLAAFAHGVLARVEETRTKGVDTDIRARIACHRFLNRSGAQAFRYALIFPPKKRRNPLCGYFVKMPTWPANYPSKPIHF